MRVQHVLVNGKKIEIREKKVGELEKQFDTLKGELSQLELGGNMAELLGNSFVYVKSKLLVFFPELTAEDINEAYPSEIENLISTYVEVNFFGIRQLAGQLMQVVAATLGKSLPGGK